MKIFYLKQLRSKIWNKYEVRDWSNIAGCSEKPWYICNGPKTVLAYHSYETKEEAIKEMKKLWWEEAAKFLWEHKTKRKKNKYPW